MAIKLTNLAGSLSAFFRAIGSTTLPTAGEGILATHLEDLNGKPLALKDGQAINAEQFGLPLILSNDGNAVLARGDRFGGLATARFTSLFNLYIEGSTLDTRKLMSAATTMTASVTIAGGLVLNTASTLTASAYINLATARPFPSRSKTPLLMRIRAKAVNHLQANATARFGFYTNTVPTNVALSSAIYWRFDQNGIFPVFAFNGTDLLGTDVSGLITAGRVYIWEILKDDEAIHFLCQDPENGNIISRQAIHIPNTQVRLQLTDHLVGFANVFNGAVAPAAACQLHIGSWVVMALDEDMGMEAGELATMNGNSSATNPVNFALTSNLANSTITPTVTLSNSTVTAATLDGGIRFAAPVGAVTDYLLFGMQSPFPFMLKTRKVTIGAKNLGAIVATTPTQIDFFVATNGSALSLGTAGYAKHFIGTQTFPVGAAIGSVALEGMLEQDFSCTPEITESQRYHSIVARVTTGTATASQVIEVYAKVVGNFE